MQPTEAPLPPPAEALPVEAPPPAPPPGPALVLGLGESGLAMAHWLVREGRTVRVHDTRATPPRLDALRRELPGVTFETGPLPAGPGEAALVAVSPGLRLADPAMRALRAATLAQGGEFVGEIELFARALAALKAGRGYAPFVLGVTGTNGKTTTVQMLGAMVARAGRSVRVAGNVSPSALDALRQAVDAASLPDFWVLELSSFQLASTHSLQCHAAAVLNVTEDHLDWHEGMEDYLAAKLRLLPKGTHAVYPAGAPWAARLPQGPEQRTSFGLAAPTATGEFGLIEQSLGAHGSLCWLACTQASLPQRRRRRAGGSKAAALRAAAGAATTATPVTTSDPVAGGAETPSGSQASPAVPGAPAPAAVTAAASTAPLAAPAPVEVEAPLFEPATPDALPAEPVPDHYDEPLFLQRLMPTDDMAVRGRHNALNALAALALARTAGVPMAACLKALQAFRADAHRTQTVATVAGVEYIDDSKGTNVGATVAAIEGLHGPGRGLIVLLGGDGKGQSFEPLARAVREHVRIALVIGRDGPRIAQALDAAGARHESCPDLAAAVRRAAQLAHEGEIVLLSPACASFDAFRDYAHRAEVFREAVLALPVPAAPTEDADLGVAGQAAATPNPPEAG